MGPTPSILPVSFSFFFFLIFISLPLVKSLKTSWINYEADWRRQDNFDDIQVSMFDG